MWTASLLDIVRHRYCFTTANAVSAVVKPPAPTATDRLKHLKQPKLIPLVNIISSPV